MFDHWAMFCLKNQAFSDIIYIFAASYADISDYRNSLRDKPDEF